MRAMGLDIGSVTVGVALSDGLKMIANSYTVIRYEEENDALFNQIVNIIKEQEVDEVIVGMPYHMNGDFSVGCERTRRFEEKIKQLEQKVKEQDQKIKDLNQDKITNEFLKVKLNYIKYLVSTRVNIFKLKKWIKEEIENDNEG